MSLFNFKLNPVEACIYSQGAHDKRDISWYWITDSRYYIQLGHVKLYESSWQWQQAYPDESPYLSYPYAHFLDDFFHLLPQVSVEMPSEIYGYVDTPEKYEGLKTRLVDWYAALAAPMDEQEDVNDTLTDFLWYCRLDSAYLAYRSCCCFYHVGNMVHIQYDFRDRGQDNVPIWSAGCGQYTILYSEFIEEVEDLLVRFFRAMDVQVDMAAQLVLHNPQYIAYEVFLKRAKQEGNLALSVEYLKKEHLQREEGFRDTLAGLKNNSHPVLMDWGIVKNSLDYLFLQ